MISMSMTNQITWSLPQELVLITIRINPVNQELPAWKITLIEAFDFQKKLLCLGKLKKYLNNFVKCARKISISSKVVVEFTWIILAGPIASYGDLF